MLDIHRRLLRLAALGFARLELRDAPEPSSLSALKTWLGSWRGVGLITEAMLRRGYDLALTSDEQAGGRPSYAELVADAVAGGP